ncbi:hypothetical protein ABB37_04242 [Leptomonas pyrrhocoris]|uniref:Bacterial transcriptional activator domain-containing protein n=1 Tax=Leptomonas pyrrhocoris TaxID=157538 RepID=A0A0N0DVY8_LEPPY|nr:hypothetical protein ABB37_04242 [Leptomonas pyrrhocoris]XP_015659243.1 hypothetical protein ABB37_04242 [Leptomonas pyrrhocoris]KPA80803.1 hypothetical protein ABB37_04242 [Leptomonas pyrrhocoris]KPA80804.1 hypothetical protein ABB37_04242 [Leptomonas pyrrhocoris]|eukprot:XP_015659242.1 hypothetical protein ABB37_04242 [Leptomonas pyrrhocoris]
MSATPPPPPPSMMSSSPTFSQPHGRASGGPFRTGGAAGGVGTSNPARPRPSPQQRAPTNLRTMNPLFTFSGGHSGPAPNVAGTGGSSAPSNSNRNATARVTTAPTSTAHVDPAAATTRPPSQAPTEPTSAAPFPTASAELLRSLTAAVHESLAGYLYHDAIELAQRLMNLDASYGHLHLLAHCYLLSGGVGTAYRLLHHHYPFFEVHVTRPRTAAVHGRPGTGGVGGGWGGGGVGFTAVDGAALPLDARRTWNSTAPAHGPSTTALLNALAHGEVVDLSYETVDLKAQWDCQYLLGVCCYRTQHYEDGVKVLSQLLYVKYQLDAAAAALRKQQQQQQSSSSPPSSSGTSVERQLHSYAFASEARVSQVLYWLGLCEKHRQRPPFALDYLRRAFSGHPTRIDAFREYVRLAWPSVATAQELLAVKEPLAEENDGDDAMADGGRANGEGGEEEDDANEDANADSQRPPQRRGRDAAHAEERRGGDDAEDVDEAEETEKKRAAVARTGSLHTAGHRGRGGAARPPASPGSPTSSGSPTTARRHRHCGATTPAPAAFTLDAPPLTPTQRRVVQQHLQPFLRAIFLTTTYRCPEAVDALQKLLLQQQLQAQSPATASSISGTSSSASDTARPAGLPRTAPPTQSHEGPPPVECGRVHSVAGVSLAVSPLLLRQLALAQFHNGDVQASADTFDRLLRVAPWELTDPALIYYSTALWHLKSESALGSLAQCLTDAEPFHPTTLCVVANAYSLVKDPRDALVMLKRAVQLAPNLAYAHALYGYELLGQDNKAEAEKAFKTALAVDNTLYIAYAGLGERFIREEQVIQARGYYKEAVKINPTPAIMNRFALTYHRQNNVAANLECALRLYSESLQRHPNNLTARRQRTDVLLRLDRPKEALAELKALLVQCPGEAAIHMALAECMVCLKRPQEALQNYQTAMHLDPRRESYVQGCIDRLVAAKML